MTVSRYSLLYTYPHLPGMELFRITGSNQNTWGIGSATTEVVDIAENQYLHVTANAGDGTQTYFAAGEVGTSHEIDLDVYELTGGNYTISIVQQVDSGWEEIGSASVTTTGMVMINFTPQQPNLAMIARSTGSGSSVKVRIADGKYTNSWRANNFTPQQPNLAMIARSTGSGSSVKVRIADGKYTNERAYDYSYTLCSKPRDNYRYGFNGKEKDNEIAGIGNFQDYGFREYDDRIARFNAVDPITKKYPSLTPYQFASNTPIQATDLDGLEANYIWQSTGYNPNTTAGEFFDDLKTAMTNPETYKSAMMSVGMFAVGALVGIFTEGVGSGAIAEAEVAGVSRAAATMSSRSAAAVSSEIEADVAPAFTSEMEGAPTTRPKVAVESSENVSIRTKNRLPDKGEPNTMKTNRPGTTTKKYGKDGYVVKEYNKGHPSEKGTTGGEDHVHDYKPNPHPNGTATRMKSRPPKPNEFLKDKAKVENNGN